jgi:hypothetical protein
MRHASIGKVVASWPFLVCLVALLANDWWLKAAHPGVISGKLSDFAGVALVGMFLMAALPRHMLTLSLSIAALFLWWKSPWSQSAIELINAIAPFQIGRTVDYTDLAALGVLPVCAHVVDRAGRYSLRDDRLRRALFVPLVATTAFAVMGTSAAPTRETYSIRSSSAGTALQREAVAEAIAELMQQQGLECRDCAKPSESAKYSGRDIALSYTFDGPDAIHFQIEAWTTALFFGASGSEKAAALRSAVKSMLARRFTDLEYVEPLQPPP